MNYKPSPFSTEPIDYSTILDNTFECPNCYCKIAITQDQENYKKLYKEAIEIFNETQVLFNNFLTRMGNECIDAKIWMELEKEKLEQDKERIRKWVKENNRDD
jgi:hypothetical protein